MRFTGFDEGQIEALKQFELQVVRLHEAVATSGKYSKVSESKEVYESVDSAKELQHGEGYVQRYPCA